MGDFIGLKNMLAAEVLFVSPSLFQNCCTSAGPMSVSNIPQLDYLTVLSSTMKKIKGSFVMIF